MQETTLLQRKRVHPLRDRAVLFGTPLLLSILLLFHPILDRDHTLSQLAPIAVVWIGIHIVLVPGFGLMIWCFFLLLEGVSGWPARLSRGAALIWGVLSIAYESAVGLVGGLFSLNESIRTAGRQIVQQALTRYLYSPVFGRSALMIQVSGLIAVLGMIWALYRVGVPRILLPFLLLGGLCIAQGHESPFGPLGYGMFATGAFCIECFWQNTSAIERRGNTYGTL